MPWVSSSTGEGIYGWGLGGIGIINGLQWIIMDFCNFMIIFCVKDSNATSCKMIGSLQLGSDLAKRNKNRKH